MRALLLVPAIVSTLLFGAHLLRSGWAAAAIMVAISPLLLLVRRSLATIALEALLLLGAFEWVRTLVLLVERRQTAGLPYLRMAAILGAVALLTAISAPLLERWRRRPAVEARA